MGSLVHTNTTFAEVRYNRTIFRNPRTDSNQYYYALYLTDVFVEIYLEYSTDGVDWSNARQGVYTTEHCSGFDMKIYDTGSDLKIFLVLYNWDDEDLTYMRGSISDAGTTPVWDTPQDIDSTCNYLPAFYPRHNRVGICRNYNGYLIVAYNEDASVMGKAYRRTKIVGSDGDGAAPTWLGTTTLDDPSAQTNNEDKGQCYVGVEAFSSTYPNRFLVYARVPNGNNATAYDLKLWVYDWDGSTMSFVASDTISSTNDPDWGWHANALIDDDDKVHIVYEDDVNDLQHAKYPTAGGLGAESITELSADGFDCVTITLDRTNDEVYVLYHHDADMTNYHYKKSDAATISFGAEQTITFSGEICCLRSWHSDIENELLITFVSPDVYYDILSLAPPPTGVGPNEKQINRLINARINDRIN